MCEFLNVDSGGSDSEGAPVKKSRVRNFLDNSTQTASATIDTNEKENSSAVTSSKSSTPTNTPQNVSILQKVPEKKNGVKSKVDFKNCLFSFYDLFSTKSSSFQLVVTLAL